MVAVTRTVPAAEAKAAGGNRTHGFTLFLMTLLLNAVSIRFVRKYRQVYE